MQFKRKALFEKVIGEGENAKVFEFFLPEGATLGEAYDAGHEYLQSILEQSRKANENVAPKQEKKDESEDAQ